MSRNTISTFSLILLIGAVMWFFHMNRQSETIESAEPLQAEQPAIAQTMPRPTTPSSSPSTPPPIPPRASALSGELETLEQELAAAQEALQDQRQSFQELQGQSQGLEVRVPASDNLNAVQVLRSEMEMDNVMMELDSYRNLEAQITRQAEEQIRMQNSAAQMQMQQLEDSIRTQQDLIQRTREDLQFWNSNFNNLTEQQAQLQRLQTLLDEQNLQLDLMLQQRLLISSEALSNVQAIQAQKQNALANLQEERSSAQGEIESLRDSIIRLQQSQREIRNTQISLSSQLRQAQQSLQNQEAQVRALETSVEQKRQELQSLVQ